MKKSLVLLFALLSSSAGAQEVEVVDSIDMDSGNYIIEYVEDRDSIRADTIDLSTPSIPQIPLEKCDSLTLNSPGDRYGVVWNAEGVYVYQESGEREWQTENKSGYP